jgi:PAS domain S-box-containing protein
MISEKQKPDYDDPEKGSHSSSQSDIQQLRRDLKKYKDLFENAPIGIVQTTLDGRLLDANPAIASILGYDSPSEYIDAIQNIAEDMYVDPARRQTLIDLSLKQNQLLNFKNQFRCKDGRIITCRLNIRTARGADGNVSYLESFIEDLTGQEKTAEALEESEALYRGIFENTGAGTIIIEEDTTISFANSGFEKLTGYSKAETEGQMKWPTIVADPADLEMMLRYHRERRQGDEQVPIEYEFKALNKSGEKRHVFIRVDMIPGTTRSVASLIDITSLKEAEQSFRESESKLSGVLEAFEGFVYICSQDYRISYMNRTLKDFIGRDGTGSVCYEEIYGLNKPCDWCAHQRLFEGESVKIEFQNPRNGRWSYAVNTPIFTDDHSVATKQTVIIDIHERKIAEDAIREQERHLKKENVRLRTTIQDRYKFGGIVGKSSAMQKVYELILRAAATDANVIIYGESGTGKELVAKAIHDMSDRGPNTFVPVNCGAIPRQLVESEFFGYKKGAFTGALADKPGYLDQAEKGSLFLDELGEIQTDMQVKLLRVLGGSGYTPVGSVNVTHPDIRIIAATNRNVRKLLEQGKMREDFFYRIHIIPIQLPPLRERKEDIPLLAEHFLKKYQQPEPDIPLTGHVMDALLGYDWPGNVRELENSIQRLINLGYLDFLETSAGQAASPSTLLGQKDPRQYDQPLRQAVGSFEKRYISKVLDRYKWNRTRAAKKLGIERKTLYLKMKSLGLQDSV